MWWPRPLPTQALIDPYFETRTEIQVADSVEDIGALIRYRRLRPGDSLPGDRSDRLVISAEPGEVIDVMVFGTVQGALVIGPNGERGFPAHVHDGGHKYLLMGWEVPSGFPTLLSVSAQAGAWSASVRQTGAAMMLGRARHRNEAELYLDAPLGTDVAVDTLWFRNDGGTAASWAAEILDASVSATPLEGSIPSGGVRTIEVSADVSGLGDGAHYLEALRLGLPSDPWAARAFRPITFRVIYDARIEVVGRGLPFRTAGAAPNPDERLLFVAGTNVEARDPATGDRAVLHEGVADSDNPAKPLVVGPDSSIYVADAGPTVVLRIGTDGSRSTVLSVGGSDSIWAVAASDDGSLWASAGAFFSGRLYRVSPGGDVTVVDSGRIAGVTYHAPSDMVYYGKDGTVVRVDSSTGISEVVDEFSRASSKVLAIDSGHRLYALARSAEDTRIDVFEGFYDPSLGPQNDLQLVDSIAAPPGDDLSITVVGTFLYEVTSGCCGNLYDRGVIFRVPIA